MIILSYGIPNFVQSAKIVCLRNDTCFVLVCFLAPPILIIDGIPIKSNLCYLLNKTLYFNKCFFYRKKFFCYRENTFTKLLKLLISY